MGVTGLLPLLKDIQEVKSLSSYKGQTLAVDAYAWLHRSVYSCTYELSNDLSTFKYLNFFKKRICLFKSYGIELYFVFDGDEFNSKKTTEIKRKEARENNKMIGLEMLKGGANYKKAMDFLKKSIDVTPEIAKTVIDYLIAENIKILVAPYESDSQLVYLEKLKLVDGIISEDSDLLIFGCQKLLTKFNDKDNTVIEIDRSNFVNLKNLPMINSFTPTQFKIIACLSGCDYTKGIPKIGLKKSFQIVRHYQTFDKAIMKLKLDGFQIPKDFISEYERAYLSFTYPRVFNPVTLEINTLNNIPENLKVDPELLNECIGELLPLELHRQIAKGELNPFTKEKLVSREQYLLSNRNGFIPHKKRNNTNSNDNDINIIVQRAKSLPVSSKPINTLDMFNNFIKKHENFKNSDFSNNKQQNSVTIDSKLNNTPSIKFKAQKIDRSMTASSIIESKSKFTGYKEKMQRDKRGLKIFRDTELNVVSKKLIMFNDILDINKNHYEKDLATLNKKKLAASLTSSKYFQKKEKPDTKITIIKLDIVTDKSIEDKNAYLKMKDINVRNKSMMYATINEKQTSTGKKNELRKISLLNKYSFKPKDELKTIKENHQIKNSTPSKLVTRSSDTIKEANDVTFQLKKRKLAEISKIQNVSKYLSQSEAQKENANSEYTRTISGNSLINRFAYAGEND